MAMCPETHVPEHASQRKPRASCNEIWHDRDLLGVIPEGIVGDTISTGGGGAVFERARACSLQNAAVLQFAASRFFSFEFAKLGTLVRFPKVPAKNRFFEDFVKTVQRKGGWHQKS